jgi:hypothetical protein
MRLQKPWELLAGLRDLKYAASSPKTLMDSAAAQGKRWKMKNRAIFSLGRQNLDSGFPGGEDPHCLCA